MQPLMGVEDKKRAPDASTLRESLVKDSFANLDWPRLQKHLDEIFFSEAHLPQLRGHFRRHSQFVFPYPQKALERQRNTFFQSLQNYIELQLGHDAKKEVGSDIDLLNTIEAGYRGIIALLDKCAISQHPPDVRVSATISRACQEYEEWIRRHETALVTAKELEITTGVLITGDDGNKYSLDAAVEELSIAVAKTLIMEAHKNDWFVDDIVTLPILPTVGKEECNQSGSVRILAACWQQWRKVERRIRFLGGELLEHSGDERPVGLPKEISKLYEYRPANEGSSMPEIYDFVANLRLHDKLAQFYIEMAVETSASTFATGIANGAMLPPQNIISDEELLCCSALSEILGYSVLEDSEKPCGIRLIEWIRGYFVLKEVVKGRLADGSISYANCTVKMSEKELMEALTTCGLYDEAAEKFISLTCVHRHSSDLFDCPIIKSADSSYLLFGPSLVGLNVPLAILSNLSERRVNLGRKGLAFEKSVREFLEGQDLDVYSFRVHREDQEYEYDAVVPWDGYVFVFECKNHSLSGNDPGACYFFDLAVASQEKQVRRLATALKKYPDILKEHVGEEHVGGEIVPCVVHSLPYAKFGQSRDVYFMDFSMLSRFFEEPYLKVKMPHTVGDFTVLHRVGVKKFWSGDAPTAEDLLDQMRCPFQLELTAGHLGYRAVTFPIGSAEVALVPELVREELSVESVCKIMNVNPEYVRREIEDFSSHVQKLRVEMDNSGDVSGE